MIVPLAHYCAGMVPFSWSTLHKLNYLVLSSNNLTGASTTQSPCPLLDTKQFAASLMTVLNVPGALPSSWYALQDLSTLSLASNRLSGIP